MRTSFRGALAAIALSFLVLPLGPSQANAGASRAHGEFGSLYLDGRIVRTFGTPVQFPGRGRDPLYTFSTGVEKQFSVSAVGPGTGEFHGGAWQIFVVTWNTAPYLITSDEGITAAAEAGDITVTRNEAADFRCPVLP